MHQLGIPFDHARDRRDDGIDRAAENAGLAWRLAARAYLVEYLLRIGSADFLAEDAREYAEGMGLEDPPDGRAWGAVVLEARRAGVIRKVGAAPARSSNLSYKTLWRGA